MFTFPTFDLSIRAMARYVRFLADEKIITEDQLVAAYALLAQIVEGSDIDALRDLADEMQLFINESVTAFKR